jgi:MoaA/NifB/PqqE/SkfB family radical SAM enzyme
LLFLTGAAGKFLRCFREPSYAWWVIYSRALRARAAYQRRVHGVVPPPKRVVLQLTAACNRHCEMCNLWGDHGVLHRFKHLELHAPFERIKRMYDEVIPYTPVIELMGGEPLVHPQFREIMEYFRGKPLQMTLETNGVLLEKYADILSGPPLQILNVSLDGPEEVHDRIRGVKGTYAACRKGIEAVLARRSPGGLPRIHVRCTINRRNQHLLEATARMLAGSGIDLFVLQHLIYYNNTVHPENERVMKTKFGIDLPSDLYGLIPFPAEMDGPRIIEQITALREADLPFPVVANPNYDDEIILEYYRGGQIREPRSRCHAPFVQASIDFRGNVTSCHWAYMGNAHEEGLLNVWNNERFRSFRKNMDRVKRIPLCKICCYPD